MNQTYKNVVERLIKDVGKHISTNVCLVSVLWNKKPNRPFIKLLDIE